MLLILNVVKPQGNLVRFAHGGKEHLEHSVTSVRNALHTDIHTKLPERFDFCGLL